MQVARSETSTPRIKLSSSHRRTSDEAAFVHFFLSSAKGNVVLVNDVNARVAKLLSPPWKDDAKGFLRVETIQGRKVELATTDFAHAPFQTHTFWVTVGATGKVRLAQG